MRQSVAAVALLRREHEGRTLWLAQWNPKWQCYHFVAGHKRPDESFRQCVVREVTEELDLRAEVDFQVAPEPLAQLEYDAWSEGAQAETHYTMALFEVELLHEAARQAVDAGPQNRWLSQVEIHAQRCDNGQAVSPTMALLLSKLGWNP